MALASEIEFRLRVFRRVKSLNAYGETVLTYEPDGAIWGKLTVASARTETITGDAERVVITHKLTVRAGGRRIATDDRLEYQGQRYDVQYWQPYYKRRDRVEIMLKLVIEDGA